MARRASGQGSSGHPQAEKGGVYVLDEPTAGKDLAERLSS